MKVTFQATRYDAGDMFSKVAARLRDAQRTIGTALVRLIQQHFRGLPPNKMGWPSTGFWAGAARGVGWDRGEGGTVVIYADNEEHPGAVRQLYYGGTIRAKDKKLTIPARAEFYGHRAGEFDNLKVVVFGNTGTAALVVGPGGTGLVDFSTGRSRIRTATGVRAAGVVAYWLKDEVTQPPHPEVLPTDGQIADAAIVAVAEQLRLEAAK